MKKTILQISSNNPTFSKYLNMIEKLGFEITIHKDTGLVMASKDKYVFSYMKDPYMYKREGKNSGFKPDWTTCIKAIYKDVITVSDSTIRNFKERKYRNKDRNKYIFDYDKSYDKLKDITTNCIYILFELGIPIYIGKSTSVFSRIFQNHMFDKNFDTITVVEFCSPVDAEIIEPYLVNELKPRLNKEFMCGDCKSSFKINYSQYITKTITLKACREVTKSLTKKTPKGANGIIVFSEE